MGVTIRTKAKRNGHQVVYYDVVVDGRRKWIKSGYELLPETDKVSKDANKRTMLLAERMRNDIEMQIAGMASGAILPASKTRIDAFVETLAKGKSESWLRNVRCAMVHFKDLTRAKYVSDINSDRLRMFAQTMGKEMNRSTVRTYTNYIKAVYSEARRRKIVSGELMVEPIRVEKAKREFLTVEEQRAMASTRNMRSEVERMFLFSCQTGLRISDMLAMKWSDIKKFGERTRLCYRMVKTKQPEWIDLNVTALRLLEEVKNDDVYCFHLNRAHRCTASDMVRRWALRSGVCKYITFHSARHTFAVTLLSKGVDIYTVSRLLGHASVKTTEIYADIVDKKRTEAVDLLPEL